MTSGWRLIADMDSLSILPSEYGELAPAVMVPPSDPWCISSESIIHRSAWKVNSRKSISTNLHNTTLLRAENDLFSLEIFN